MHVNKCVDLAQRGECARVIENVCIIIIITIIITVVVVVVLFLLCSLLVCRSRKVAVRKGAAKELAVLS